MFDVLGNHGHVLGEVVVHVELWSRGVGNSDGSHDDMMWDAQV